MSPLRGSAWAGRFYAGDAESLREQLEGCFEHRNGPGRLPEVNEDGPRRIIGIVSPHAGYMYSGMVAAHGFYRLAQDGVPQVAVILGPNHQWLGSELAIYAKGGWETPLGVVKINENIAAKILEKTDLVQDDERAHVTEHSLEVQLPFLQYIYGNDITFVPICMRHQGAQECSELGRAIAEAIEGENAVIIASSDFTHYETQASAEKKDGRALEEILNMRPDGLINVVAKFSMSMCGVGPVATMLYSAKELSATGVELLKYATSGDITGDRYQVVGYASVAVSK